ncbi:MAG: hypothetical protein A2X94_03505 [Bdellovibrionales bacterium GWB1_55_8]|nr:MAG: hypothetical protein A2X94_03505 [Bdellovibrionales bacterium GWB1_55_8]
MSFYEEKIFPIGNNLISRRFFRHKENLLKSCKGNVLEIGFGAGLSLPFYPAAVTLVTGLEPNAGMRRMVEKSASFPPANIVAGVAEQLPFPDSSFDSVVSIFTLCSVTDLEKSVSEIKRVLKRDGRFYFIEHAVQPKPGPTRTIQNLIQPVWGKIGCGCHVNRDTLQALVGAGFKIEKLKSIGYSGFPNFLSPLYRGIATKDQGSAV